MKSSQENKSSILQTGLSTLVYAYRRTHHVTISIMEPVTTSNIWGYLHALSLQASHSIWFLQCFNPHSIGIEYEPN